MNPTVLLIPKKSWIRGRRRSLQTITTFAPAPARATPRLASVVVLPSRAFGLVTWIRFTGRSTPMNWIDVRSVRFHPSRVHHGFRVRGQDATPVEAAVLHHLLLAVNAVRQEVYLCAGDYLLVRQKGT